MNMNLTLVMQAVAFFAFILFTAKVVWPPLIRAIETRQRQIAEGLQAGEQGKQSLATAEKRISAMLDEAKQKAAEIVATGEKFRSETVEAARGEAQAEKERILASGKSEPWSRASVTVPSRPITYLTMTRPSSFGFLRNASA